MARTRPLFKYMQSQQRGQQRLDCHRDDSYHTTYTVARALDQFISRSAQTALVASTSGTLHAALSSKNMLQLRNAARAQSPAKNSHAV